MATDPTSGPAPSGDVVVHLVGRDDWARAGAALTPPSLESEGFVHLSRPDQIAWVAQQRYAGREDLLMLVVDPALLPRPLVWEDCYETGQDFPHLYAPLPTPAVRHAIPYQPGPDGTFGPPPLP